MSSHTIFGSAGEKALQGHSKFFGHSASGHQQDHSDKGLYFSIYFTWNSTLLTDWVYCACMLSQLKKTRSFFQCY